MVVIGPHSTWAALPFAKVVAGRNTHASVVVFWSRSFKISKMEILRQAFISLQKLSVTPLFFFPFLLLFFKLRLNRRRTISVSCCIKRRALPLLRESSQAGWVVDIQGQGISQNRAMGNVQDKPTEELHRCSKRLTGGGGGASEKQFTT